MKKATVTLVFIFLSAITTFAQEEVLNEHSIIDMKKAGLSDKVISKKIALSKTNFNLSTDILILLKERDISDNIIQQMILKKEQSSKPNVPPTILTSIRNTDEALILNESYTLNKGDSIQIYLPVKDNFLFIKRKSFFNTKLIKGIADIVEVGSGAIGLGTGNIKVMSDAMEVMRKASAVKYGADALERINDLDISKKAKRIAGKKAKVLKWSFTEDGYVLDVKVAKKKYEVYLQEALMVREIKLIE